MNTKYTNKLDKLRARRTPRTKSASLSAGIAMDSADLRPALESFEEKGKGDATRYALGCMAEVPPQYTAISLRDGNRIADQLTGQSEFKVITRLQGSVPLNIHIYASSDVDLLVLADWFVNVKLPVVPPSTYDFANGPASSFDELVKLRSFCERFLPTKYPAADVDTSGAKSIAVSGGSLARKVDVVPSYWVDTVEYQQSKLEIHRDVAILDKVKKETVVNRPFMHMGLIDVKDTSSNGHAKRAIRLLKCLSRDADVDIALSSFDIAGLIYHMPNAELSVNPFFPLQLLDRVDLYLRRLESNYQYATSLQTPDGTRAVLDSSEKFFAVAMLRQELTEAIDNVAGEYNDTLPFIFDRSRALEAARKTLNETLIY
ncbi:hypothetical protein DR64_2259 [Paraburkholderia xenovorans LB400]|uniref:Uncharacterized protein n=1 Tax=Paraburkholderia xenovorans (strain LB400) TaxID=266265 RepID=Q13SU1_PARXL|nr:hypothetical protein [Paraburkholderia xenovorans]ABE32848.1 hypothetical protein Bxe_A0083 [Paraburkholderia xenovorans LB400]AIP30347.1 hypothetical protein DR64_2259 [Paraburkholderia xenovorans LB400]